MHIFVHPMIEPEYIQYCLSEIEKKLNWRDSHFWRESDYQKLAGIISEESGISISPHTLKRLFGKLKYNKYYNPQQATKNALAKFIGFRDWDDFVVNHPKSETSQPVPNQVLDKRKQRLNKGFFILSVLLLSVLLLVFFGNRFLRQTPPRHPSFSFSLMDSAGTVPFTVSARYDFSAVRSDSIFIDFDFTHPVMGPQLIIPDKSRFSHNFTYQIPGYYHIRVTNKEKILATKSILAMSDGWDSYFLSEDQMDRRWLDNEIQKQDSDGYLYFSPEDLKVEGFDTQPVYYIANRLYKQFGIDGDNFLLETRFKNSRENGGITCYDAVFQLICQNNTNSILLMEEGCSQFSGIKFGETLLEGEYEDLSAFKLDIKGWNVLNILVENKHVQVSINSNLVYEGSYTQPNGKIVGIENRFKGSGMLDYIKIQDLTTQQIYSDDFE